MNRDLSNMRLDYDFGILDESHVDANPFIQFERWFNEALEFGIKEPNAMIISTVDANGFPSSRTVLLKGYDKNGLVFYTNYDSDKAKAIEATGNVSVLFLWKDMERQVRIDGSAERISKAASKAYFDTRPRGSRIGAWVSPQSQIIESRDHLNQLLEETENRFKEVEDIPLPPNWGGYTILPRTFEFWQGRSNRLHDRIKYEFDGGWKIYRLAP